MERSHPPHPASRTQSNQSRPQTASSAAAARTDSATPSPSPTPTNGAPSSSTPSSVADNTPSSNAQPSGGTEYVVISEDDQVVGCKRKRKSDIWLDFDEVTIGGRQKHNVVGVKKYLVADGKSGTTHLCGHLNICASCQVRKGLQQTTLKLGKKKHGSVVVEKYAFD
jgi:hypothetical protein